MIARRIRGEKISVPREIELPEIVPVPFDTIPRE
jgi:hypothetical protein